MDNKQVARDISAIKADYRALLRALLENAEKGGEIEITSIEDLEKVIKIDLLLIGEVTNIKDTGKQVINLPQELRDLIDMKIKELSNENIA